ncbi:hypothetical protein V6Z11_D04G167500 [Gossypium hirsutum]
MLRRSCAFDLCQDSDCNGDGQRSGGQASWRTEAQGTWRVRRQRRTRTEARHVRRAWRRRWRLNAARVCCCFASLGH